MSMMRASRTRRRVRQGNRGLSRPPGAGSGKDDDETLPDIGKLSMAEEKKDNMDVDQGNSKRGSSTTFKSGMCEPKPRDTEAGQVSLNKMQFEEYRKAAPRYEYSGEGDDKRLLPKNTPIEKPLPAKAALLIPRRLWPHRRKLKRPRGLQWRLSAGMQGFLMSVRRTGWRSILTP